MATPIKRFIDDYTQKLRDENVISEAVKFLKLDAFLSSPILNKAHFDVRMTMVADTLYCMLVGKLREFKHCDARSIYRYFANGKGQTDLSADWLMVIFCARPTTLSRETEHSIV